jgi:hypothetical protein
MSLLDATSSKRVGLNFRRLKRAKGLSPSGRILFAINVGGRSLKSISHLATEDLASLDRRFAVVGSPEQPNRHIG